MTNSINIPKIFYLTFKEGNPKVDKRINQIHKFYPEFKVETYNNKECISFLESNYPDNHVQTFKKLKNGAHKADFFRYCILYKKGGIYIDMDNIIQKNIYNLVSKYHFTSCLHIGTSPKYSGCTKYNKKHIHQGFIATEPKIFILKHLINHMINNPKPHITEFAPFSYHFYVRYFYKYLLSILKLDELFHSIEYKINKKKIFLIDTTDTTIMKYGVRK